jgi:hypothetical protein
MDVDHEAARRHVRRAGDGECANFRRPDRPPQPSQFGELEESFGRAFLEAVASGVSEGTDAGDALSQSMNDLTPAIEDLGR